MKRINTISTAEPTVNIGISSCLIGEKVRYDGSHKLDRSLVDTIGRGVGFLPVCPEVGCGLSVPREAMRLVGDRDNPRLVTIHTNIDLTPQMEKFCRQSIRKLKRVGLCGFIFKKNSPSSGLYRVKVYDSEGKLAGTGQGLFARAITENFPLLPVEEDERLHDPDTRENFIERIFAYQRWQNFLRKDFSLGRLVKFHTAHKLLMLAHSTEAYREMGRLVAAGAGMEKMELIKAYGRLYMEGMAKIATVRKHYNALQHIAGYFRKLVDEEERQALNTAIEEYQNRLSPLIVPIALLKHYAERHDVIYLQQQVYLTPSPQELMLRNHA